MQPLRGLAAGRQAISRALLPFCAQLRRPEDTPELCSLSRPSNSWGQRPPCTAMDLGTLTLHFPSLTTQNSSAKRSYFYRQVCASSRVFVWAADWGERRRVGPTYSAPAYLNPRPMAGYPECQTMLCCPCPPEEEEKNANRTPG